ncbi:MAG: preprotein translocase subunit YajC [Proteobacteria bacterium]|nr:preprotein translocase subunit YajC [Pseudomonadota bacterium]
MFIVFISLLALLIVNPALAHDASQQGSTWGSLIPMVLIIGVFYFLLIRPQQKQAKKHKAMLDNLKRNDSVTLGGGIIGVIVKVEADFLFVEVAHNVRVKVRRDTISQVNEISDEKKLDVAQKPKKKKDEESSGEKKDDTKDNAQDDNEEKNINGAS